MPSSGNRGADRSAAAYDHDLVPWLFRPWAEPFVDLAAPSPSSQVVDLGCGTGLIVRHLLDRLDGEGRIHGVDLDPAMLRRAAGTIDDDRVSWHESDAANLSFASDSIDAATCHQGLQFFPDPGAVLAEVGRMLVPGGRFTLAVWGPIDDNPWPASLAAAVGEIVGDTAAEGMAVVCGLGDPDAVAAILANGRLAEITVHEHERFATHPDVKAAVEGQLSALPSGADIDSLDAGRRGQLVERMCELLAEFTDDGALTVPSTCNFATAVRPEL